MNNFFLFGKKKKNLYCTKKNEYNFILIHKVMYVDLFFVRYAREMFTNFINPFNCYETWLLNSAILLGDENTSDPFLTLHITCTHYIILHSI